MTPMEAFYRQSFRATCPGCGKNYIYSEDDLVAWPDEYTNALCREGRQKIRAKKPKWWTKLRGSR